MDKQDNDYHEYEHRLEPVPEMTALNNEKLSDAPIEGHFSPPSPIPTRRSRRDSL